jgi:hypothetical protein
MPQPAAMLCPVAVAVPGQTATRHLINHFGDLRLRNSWRGLLATLRFARPTPYRLPKWGCTVVVARCVQLALFPVTLCVAGCSWQPTKNDIPKRGATDVIVHCSDFDDETFDPPAASKYALPEAFRNDTVAQDISRARRHVNRMRRCYQFLGDFSAKKASQLDVPLIASAIFGTGALLYRANIDVVGGAGLAAGGISTAKLYYHPAADQQAYLAAEKQLTCIYDYTHVTRFTLAGDILANDRLLLENLIAQVNYKAGPLLYGDTSSQTSQQKALVKAVNDATTSVRKTLEAVEAALADYRQTPSAIYDTADRIDFSARDSARLTIAYADAINTIQSSINVTLQNKSTIADARTSLLKAQASSGEAAKTPAPAKKADAKGAQDPKAQAVVDLTTRKVANLPTSLTTTPQSSCAPNQADCVGVATGIDGSRGDNNAFHLRAFDPIADAETDLIAKLLAVSEASLNDIPQPAFSEVRANIAKCIVSQN